MAWAIVRSPAARSDLDGLWLDIAVHDLNAADRLIGGIDGWILKLATLPRLGRPRDDIHPGLRSLLEGKSLILYRVDDSARLVEILRVVDGRRDLAAILDL